jgi:hypothetical protein
MLISIHWYDRYIRDTLHVHIKKKEKTVNRIIKLLFEYDNQIIKDIISDLEADKLNLMRSLEYEFRDSNEDYFVQYTPIERIKGMSEFMIPIVTVLISIISITISK